MTITGLRTYNAVMVTYNLTIDGLHTYYVEAGAVPVLVHNSGPCGPFEAPEITVNRHGQLSNGRYTLDSAGMDPHVNGKIPGKSQFGYYVNSGKATLDAAAYADEYGLWVRNKAKVPTNGIVGYLGDGTPTSWINVYRTRTGFVHGSPGSPP